MNLAGKIKGSQPDVVEKQKRWEGYPCFLKNTVLEKDEGDDEAREASLPIRYQRAVEQKEEGNQLFRAVSVLGLFQAIPSDERGEEKEKEKEKNTAELKKNRDSALQCISCYEKAISLFRYLKRVETNDGPDLRLEDVILECERGQHRDTMPEWKTTIVPLLVTLYANLAAAYWKCGRHEDVVAACDEALSLDPVHMKALVRKATSERALGNIEGAFKTIKTGADAHGDKRAVKDLYRDIRKEWKEHREKENATFGGLFDRGTLYDDAESGDEAVETESGPSTVGDEKKKLEFMKEFGEKKGKNRPEDLLEMELTAKKFGIDLSDPLVQEELRRLETLKEKGGNLDEGTLPDGTRLPMAVPEDTIPFQNKGVAMKGQYKPVVISLIVIIAGYQLYRLYNILLAHLTFQSRNQD